MASNNYRCDNCGRAIEISPIVVSLQTYCSPECRDGADRRIDLGEDSDR